MGHISLNNVTLVCADDATPLKSLDLLIFLSKKISFGPIGVSVKLITSHKLCFPATHALHVVHPEKSLNSLSDYTKFMIYDLHKYIDTEFCMVVQTDGYFVNTENWSDKFLKYDYIGAPWTYQSNLSRNQMVGNGGFSIRSKKFLEASSRLEWEKGYKCEWGSWTEDNLPEDVFLCQIKRPDLEEQGINFAPVALASEFSIENLEYTCQFGFHGKNTFYINMKKFPEEFNKKFF